MTRPITRRLAPLWISLRLMLILTVLLGVAYPLLVTGIGQAVFPGQANGSLVHTNEGRVAGSALIGQRFDAADGSPLTQYFQPRPSVAGDGYDPTASAGSNLGPESPELFAQIRERTAQIAAFNGVTESEVPVDAVTASGSGLDPHISVEYARIQVRRVAEARGLSVERVAAMLERSTTGRDAGFLGEPRVNVVELNLALDGLG
ncbi:K(+)-transporting ATPase subunit C [Klugiella xanthotipulae]|uniref:Potassium-transporting ATPase KdpC subunit n=1 Tax=Klugiella xanthotipulae TaxID=244735 RepID=A0A543I6W3_9MICO|nr:potassium-transporting ATPase subunit KdpC [Klugiella xanthotipulae]TQM66343.1 K+-transporting ATPase ATPase C chain [Klugiella xanthotipulae]